MKDEDPVQGDVDPTRGKNIPLGGTQIPFRGLEEAVLSEKARAEILRIRDEYPDPRSALLPALHLAQVDYGGWLPEAAFDDVAQVMELSPTLVASVTSFYSMLYRRPVGQHTIQVCTNISCSRAGAQSLLEYLSRKL